MELLEVRGKSTPSDMVEAIEHILIVRAQAGVPPSNKYLFSRFTDTPQDGCEAMRVVTAACKTLVNPECIRTTKLRKYLATTTQVIKIFFYGTHIHIHARTHTHPSLYDTWQTVLESFCLSFSPFDTHLHDLLLISCYKFSAASNTHAYLCNMD